MNNLKEVMKKSEEMQIKSERKFYAESEICLFIFLKFISA